MHNKADWENPERDLYLRYGGDGVVDLIVGFAFCGIALMMLSDMPFVPVWIIILLMPISWALKRLITVPRLSAEEVEAQISGTGLPVRTVKLAAVSGALVLIGMALLIAISKGTFTSILGPYAYWMAIGLSLVSILVVLGLIYGAYRWAVYALLVMPLFVFGALAGIDFPLLMGALGALIFCGGLITASQFVVSHPRQ